MINDIARGIIDDFHIMESSLSLTIGNCCEWHWEIDY
jgi:hypothetical protein